MGNRQCDLDVAMIDFDVSLDDAATMEPHEFGPAYQRRKAALLESLEREPQRASRRWRLPKAAAAALVAAVVALPAGAYALASHADFLNGAFGAGWRESHSAEQAFQDHGDEKPPTPVVFPASDVVQLDPEQAEALLSGSVYDEPVIVTAPDGHLLTITTAVRSENAMVYSFTLHRDDGVTALEWNERTNSVASKGAMPPLDTQLSWSAAGDEFIYIDPFASTDTTLVGYAYTVFGVPIPDGDSVPLTVYTCDVPFNDDFQESQFHVQTIQIPCVHAVASTVFSSGPASLSVSPLGLVLDANALFESPADKDGYNMAHDPVNVRSIAITMCDGQVYTVFDQSASIDNTLSLCGFDGRLSMAFNHLVDPSQIESIEVAVTDTHNEALAVDDLGNCLNDDSNWPTRTVVYSNPRV